MFEPCRQRFGAAVAAQQHRTITRQSPDARDGEIVGQPPRVLQPRAQPGRYRKQELVILASTERITQGRAWLDGQRVGVNDGAETACLADLPYSIGQAVAQIDTCTCGA